MWNPNRNQRAIIENLLRCSPSATRETVHVGGMTICVHPYPNYTIVKYNTSVIRARLQFGKLEIRFTE